MAKRAEFTEAGARRIVAATRRIEQGIPRLGSAADNLAVADRPGRWWRCINASGQAVAGGSCVEVSGVEQEQPYFAFDVPTTFRRFWPVLETVDFASAVRGVLTFDPVALVRYDAGESPAVGDIMGPSPDSDGALVSDQYGFEVLAVLDDDYVLALQSSVESIVFNSGTGGIAAGSSASRSIYTAGGSDTGWQVSVYNQSSAAMTANLTDCVANWCGDRWVAVFEDCGVP